MRTVRNNNEKTYHKTIVIENIDVYGKFIIYNHAKIKEKNN